MCGDVSLINILNYFTLSNLVLTDLGDSVGEELGSIHKNLESLVQEGLSKADKVQVTHVVAQRVHSSNHLVLTMLTN